MPDPLGLKKVVPAYWIYYRQNAAIAGVGLIVWPGLHVLSALGRPVGAWTTAAVLIIACVVVFTLVLWLPRRFIRRIVRTIDEAGDIAAVCSGCLYVSDAVAAGKSCPECGRAHPPDIVERWVFTGRRLNDEYLFKVLVRESAVLTEAAEGHTRCDH